MRLHRFQLVPESAWRTPWQADTLAGMLCGAIARLEGGALLRQRVLDPALAGQPPFVLSDAFPGDWLPLPALARLFDWPADQRKSVKRARWISRSAFRLLQQGEGVAAGDLHDDADCFKESSQLHNTIARDRNTTASTGGLFTREETHLTRAVSCLTLYVRLAADFRELFWQAMQELAAGGFGADRSAGKGQFRLQGELQPEHELDQLDDPAGAVVLSTFQPGANDPVDGAWEALTKFGKLGPEFGLENVFKRPLVLLRPGASFQLARPRPWLGRALTMDEILAQESAAQLRSQDVEMAHLAFGLAVPLHWRTDQPIRAQTAARPRRQPAQPERTNGSTQDDPVAVRSGATGPTPGAVTVLFLGAHAGLKNVFWVQEPGKKQGLLKYGPLPHPLPAENSKIEVYSTNRNPASPEYRWDAPIHASFPERTNTNRR